MQEKLKLWLTRGGSKMGPGFKLSLMPLRFLLLFLLFFGPPSFSLWLTDHNVLKFFLGGLCGTLVGLDPSTRDGLKSIG